MAPIIKKDDVEMMTAGQAPTVRRRGHTKLATLLEVDGDVRAIQVQCTCGEKHVIELDYGNSVSTADAQQPEPNSPSPAASDAPAETGPAEESPS